MLRPTNRTNNLITEIAMLNTSPGKNTTKPLVWKKRNTTKNTKPSKRLGLGKFNASATDSSLSEKLTIETDRVSLTEDLSCLTPHKISFNRLDQCESTSLSPMLETENKKPKKTVRFAQEVSMTTHSTRLWDGVLTPEHCDQLWYQRTELAAIKQAAKVTIATRNLVEGTPGVLFDQADQLLGLERFSKQRAVWKKSTIKCVLMAQRKIKNLYAGSNAIDDEDQIRDYIQLICMRCTEWARDAALKQGFQDYCAVHDPLAELFRDTDESEGENRQNYNELIFGDMNVDNSNSKRKVGVVYDGGNDQYSDEFGRRTRHRASPPLVL